MGELDRDQQMHRLMLVTTRISERDGIPAVAVLERFIRGLPLDHITELLAQCEDGIRERPRDAAYGVYVPLTLQQLERVIAVRQVMHKPLGDVLAKLVGWQLEDGDYEQTLSMARDDMKPVKTA